MGGRGRLGWGRRGSTVFSDLKGMPRHLIFAIFSALARRCEVATQFNWVRDHPVVNQEPALQAEGESMLDRRDALVLFIAAPGGHFPVDQIRVMKGLFLWSQEGPEDAQSMYHFEPYDFGPFDTDVYRDLDGLESEGLLRVEHMPGTRQRRYTLTPKGQLVADQIRANADATRLGQIESIKRSVTSLGFEGLLRDIYQRYPEYATKSVARI